MSKTWKWILGTVIVLVVVAALGFLAWNFYGSPRLYGRMNTLERVRSPRLEEFERGDRIAPGGPYDRWQMPMTGGYERFPHPMVGYGFMSLPFLFFGGLFRLLVPLGVLALVAYVAYQQGVKAGMRASQAPPVSKPDTKGRGRKVA